MVKQMIRVYLINLIQIKRTTRVVNSVISKAFLSETEADKCLEGLIRTEKLLELYHPEWSDSTYFMVYKKTEGEIEIDIPEAKI